ncbi:MAG: hypothetical protein GY817_06435, partial [bacterium]|nr:hypothetical protein [bacterium]
MSFLINSNILNGFRVTYEDPLIPKLALSLNGLESLPIFSNILLYFGIIFFGSGFGSVFGIGFFIVIGVAVFFTVLMILLYLYSWVQKRSISENLSMDTIFKFVTLYFVPISFLSLVLLLISLPFIFTIIISGLFLILASISIFYNYRQYFEMMSNSKNLTEIVNVGNNEKEDAILVREGKNTKLMYTSSMVLKKTPYREEKWMRQNIALVSLFAYGTLYKEYIVKNAYNNSFIMSNMPQVIIKDICYLILNFISGVEHVSLFKEKMHNVKDNKMRYDLGFMKLSNEVYHEIGTVKGYWLLKSADFKEILSHNQYVLNILIIDYMYRNNSHVGNQLEEISSNTKNSDTLPELDYNKKLQEFLAGDYRKDDPINITIIQDKSHYYFQNSQESYVVGDCAFYALGRAMLEREGLEFSNSKKFAEKLITQMRMSLSLLAMNDFYLKGKNNIDTSSLILLAKSLGYNLTIKQRYGDGYDTEDMQRAMADSYM